jgi:hypothetical protein
MLRTVVAFGSLWIQLWPQTLTRFDPKTVKVTAAAIRAGRVALGIAATADSVWMITDTRRRSPESINRKQGGRRTGTSVLQ